MHLNFSTLYTKCTEALAWNTLVCSSRCVYFSAYALSYFAPICLLLAVYINFFSVYTFCLSSRVIAIYLPLTTACMKLSPLLFVSVCP
jgi:hypothetical protein